MNPAEQRLSKGMGSHTHSAYWELLSASECILYKADCYILKVCLRAVPQVVIPRDILPFVGLLFYAVIWYDAGPAIGLSVISTILNYMYSGRLSDILGRKGAMLLGLTLFSSVVLTFLLLPFTEVRDRRWDTVVWPCAFDGYADSGARHCWNGEYGCLREPAH